MARTTEDSVLRSVGAPTMKGFGRQEMTAADARTSDAGGNKAMRSLKSLSGADPGAKGVAGPGALEVETSPSAQAVRDTRPRTNRSQTCEGPSSLVVQGESTRYLSEDRRRAQKAKTVAQREAAPRSKTVAQRGAGARTKSAGAQKGAYAAVREEERHPHRRVRLGSAHEYLHDTGGVEGHRESKWSRTMASTT